MSRSLLLRIPTQDGQDTGGTVRSGTSGSIYCQRQIRLFKLTGTIVLTKLGVILAR
jgi:hypothetical protein